MESLLKIASLISLQLCAIATYTEPTTGNMDKIFPLDAESFIFFGEGCFCQTTKADCELEFKRPQLFNREGCDIGMLYCCRSVRLVHPEDTDFKQLWAQAKGGSDESKLMPAQSRHFTQDGVHKTQSGSGRKKNPIKCKCRAANECDPENISYRYSFFCPPRTVHCCEPDEMYKKLHHHRWSENSQLPDIKTKLEKHTQLHRNHNKLQVVKQLNSNKENNEEEGLLLKVSRRGLISGSGSPMNNPVPISIPLIPIGNSQQKSAHMIKPTLPPPSLPNYYDYSPPNQLRNF